MPRIRMCDADREKYGGPEWVELAMSEILDEETGLLELIEDHFDLTPEEFLARAGRASPRAVRAVIWAARRKAGCTDDPAAFRPKTQYWSGIVFEELPVEAKAREQVLRQLAEADAGPPANRAARRAKPKPKSTARSGTSSTPTGSTSPDS